jgi:hypothetical protein
MPRTDRNTLNRPRQTTDSILSRRAALGSSGVAVLGLLSHSALGQTEEEKPEAKTPAAKPTRQMQERREQSKVFSERMRSADGMEERQQIMNEQMAWQRQRAIEDLKEQLRLSDQEWSVIKPRLQTVYDLVHPRLQMMGRNELPKTEAQQRSWELRELLHDEKAAVDQIKAKLTALRAAKERTAQELTRAKLSLRQVMTLRQEALLVLNGLLD